MNTPSRALLCALLFAGGAAQGQSTAFTYQGVLQQNGVPHTGNAEIQPTLWGAVSGGTQLAAHSPATLIVGVTNGLFTASFDFGGTPFSGQSLWLQLDVRTSIGAFTTLAPRQKLTPAPYAISAMNLTGTLPASQLPAAAVTNGAAGLTLTGTFSGNGAGLADLSATSVTSGTLADTRLSANVALRSGGNTFSGNQFVNGGSVGIGTTTPATALHVRTANGDAEISVEGGFGPPPIGFPGRRWTLQSSAGTFASPLAQSFQVVDRTLGLRRMFLGSDGSVALGNEVVAGTGPSFGLGDHTSANGEGATAMGYYAQAKHDGAFVWADSTSTTPFASTSANQFLVRASGGVGIGTASPGRPLQIGDVNTPNAQGMMRFASRSGTGPSSRTWDIGVPEGDQDIGGKYYSFVIDDPGLGSEPEVVVRWDTGNVGINKTSPSSKLDVVSSGGGNAIQGTCINAGASGVYGENLTGGGFGVAGRASNAGIAVYGDNANAAGWAGFFDGNVRVTGTLNPPSDRNVKHDFANVDSREVLEKVAALSIQTWAYTNDTRGSRHLGPVAQDFQAAFGLGADDKSIATVDADGVALAAIQGLNQKLEDTRRENSALKERVENLERLLRKLVNE